MQTELDRSIYRFLGLARIWDYLLSAETEIDDWIDDFGNPIFGGNESECSKLYSLTAKATDEGERMLKKEFMKIDAAFHDMSAEELETYGVSEWNKVLSDTLYDSLCEGNIPYSYDEQLGYFRDILADCSQYFKSKVKEQ